MQKSNPCELTASINCMWTIYNQATPISFAKKSLFSSINYVKSVINCPNLEIQELRFFNLLDKIITRALPDIDIRLKKYYSP